MDDPVWKVPFVDLRGEFLAKKERYVDRMVDVCAHGRFILRQEVQELEERLAGYLGVGSCVGVGSGSDAIWLALHALGIGPGDEVITVAHTFVATLAAIRHCGATPVLVDIADDFNMDPASFERAFGPRTRAVVPVHMNGRCCDMAAIAALCTAHGVAIVEDAAQAFGASIDGVRAGAHGVLGCFSFHPLKTLHCFGDGGLVTTSDPTLADKVRILRNHGQRSRTDLAGYGYNSRLDTLQAAVLLENFPALETNIHSKRRIAATYHEAFSPLRHLTLPPPPGAGRFWDTYTSYVIQLHDRDALRDELLSKGIEVFVHGDPPLTRQPALGLSFDLPSNERISKRILSLPIFPTMTDDQIDYVVRAVRGFFCS